MFQRKKGSRDITSGSEVLRQDRKDRFRLWETAALAALCLGLCVGAWAQGRQESISSRLLRLHVVAVSDEPAEQALKLEVRDAVLQCLTPLLSDSKDAAEARGVIENNLAAVESAATLAANGRQVELYLCRERFPSRQYGQYILPAGQYDSLRIILGAGKGHNWWCVIFPPVCLGACEGEAVKSAMGSENYSIITEGEGYELRLRTLELWGSLMEKLGQR